MQANSKSQVRAMPAARFLARQKGLDLAAISPSGPEGCILKKDVEAHQAAPAAAAVAAGPAKVTSLARKLAQQKGVDLNAVQGSGPRGRITKADVLKAAAAPAPAGGALSGKKVAATSMRKTIARRLSASAFTAPHIYFFSDVKMDGLLALYRDIKQEILERHGVKNLGQRPSYKGGCPDPGRVPQRKRLL